MNDMIGHWTVLETWKGRNSITKGLCRCSCGFQAVREIPTLLRSLKQGFPTSCRQCYKKRDIKEVVGKTFGDRRVIGEIFKDDFGVKNVHFARCECICGSIDIVRATFLLQKRSHKCNKCRIKQHLKKGTLDPNKVKND